MAVVRQYPKGTLLFKEGQSPRAMYIIRTGNIAITKRKGNVEVELGILKKGEVLGEMGFFDGQPRSASAKAITDVELIEIQYDSLKAMYSSYPDYFKTIISSIVERLREANNKIKLLEESSASIDYSGRSKEHQLLNEASLIKIASLLSFIASKFGKESEKGILITMGRLRKFALQIYGIPMSRITAALDVFSGAEVILVEEDEEEGNKIYIRDMKILDGYIEWCNEEMFKAEKDKIVLSTISLGAMKFLYLYGGDGENVKYKVKNPRDPNEWLQKEAWQFNIVPYRQKAMEEHGIEIKDTSFKELLLNGIIVDSVAESAEKIYIRYEKQRLDYLYPNYRIQFNMKKASMPLEAGTAEQREQDKAALQKKEDQAAAREKNEFR
ncbi:MAG: cyclic nucleotide-binding domain-containing protein [Oligoflexia bacterium]|nr:cyclic nucleotide-binding domain-containing protein [Oligoflexia bacterium]